MRSLKSYPSVRESLGNMHNYVEKLFKDASNSKVLASRKSDSFLSDNFSQENLEAIDEQGSENEYSNLNRAQPEGEMSQPVTRTLVMDSEMEKENQRARTKVTRPLGKVPLGEKQSYRQRFKEEKEEPMEKVFVRRGEAKLGKREQKPTQEKPTSLERAQPVCSLCNKKIKNYERSKLKKCFHRVHDTCFQNDRREKSLAREKGKGFSEDCKDCMGSQVLKALPENH
mmetsp:Transcript_22237/g.21476  ORF Transcript_22237/g.21476 Transcript_22237/m.21476 type:complete len:227 (+) Transcript_22237:165-845(+)